MTKNEKRERELFEILTRVILQQQLHCDTPSSERKTHTYLYEHKQSSRLHNASGD